MFVPFFVKARHLAFDNSRVGTIVAFWEFGTGNIFEKSFVKQDFLSLINDLEFRDGVAKNTKRFDETQTVRSKTCLDCSVIHDFTNSVMSNEKTV